jgi:putative sigma-54 modulation protein
MDVTIQGNNIKITDTLEEHAKKKVNRLDRYLPNISSVRVDLAREHTRRGEDRVSAQITVHHARGAILRAEEKASGDVEKAIDAAIDKMYKQIQRFKSKRSRKGAERFTATLDELSAAEDIPDVGEYIDEYPDIPDSTSNGSEPSEPHVIVLPRSPIERRKEIDLMPMNEREAIEQMELLGHTFFMFLNATTEQVNVLYRRANGGYGILVPYTG